MSERIRKMREEALAKKRAELEKKVEKPIQEKIDKKRKDLPPKRKRVKRPSKSLSQPAFIPEPLPEPDPVPAPVSPPPPTRVLRPVPARLWARPLDEIIEWFEEEQDDVEGGKDFIADISQIASTTLDSIIRNVEFEYFNRNQLRRFKGKPANSKAARMSYGHSRGEATKLLMMMKAHFVRRRAKAYFRRTSHMRPEVESE
jgi:hypothetical protein